MSSNGNEFLEKKRAKYVNALMNALDFEMEAAVGHAGGVLNGFSVRMGEDEVLITLRVVLAGRKQIAFVGSATLGDCLLKVVREAKSDRLRWRDDKFVKAEV